METVLSLDDIVDLGCGQHLKELHVITLSDATLFELEFIALLHSLPTGLLVSRLVLTQLLHLLIDDALLTLHLTIDGEELGCLIGSEIGLRRHKLLKSGLELLGRELLLLFSAD